MPNNPFTAHEKFESKPKRNSFDRSRRNFLTGKLGALIPISLDEVNSGDSIQIDSAMLLNFFPFKFPVQTPLRASVYFFYGRNRNAWKNWQDFAYNNKQPVHPFILQPKGTFWQTGSLADYLGIPTTYSSLGSTQNYPVLDVPHSNPVVVDGVNVTPRRSKHFFGRSLPVFINNPGILTGLNLMDLMFEIPQPVSLGYHERWCLTWDYYITSDNLSLGFQLTDVPADWNSVLSDNSDTYHASWSLYDENGDFLCLSTTTGTLYTEFVKIDFESSQFYHFEGSNWVAISNLGDFLESYFSNNPSGRIRPVLTMTPAMAAHFYPEQTADPDPLNIDVMPALIPLTETNYAYNVTVNQGQAETVDLSSLDTNPFAGSVSHPPKIPINAIPFRFYEAIYNCYFRNERNDPFMINGEVEYNKYMTTQEDGADDTPYKIYYRNWETDFLTSATQTPQQGIAPLVGINVRGEMEFLNDDGTISRIKPTISDDGTTITGISGVIENGTPEALRSAMQEIMSGISINDFRNVNSLQKWLENNIRRGLKYRDQVLANTGVKIRYDELDMPEFIGGFSRPVQIQSITQATPSTASDNALGDRAGQASVFGGSNHKITHYCDEAGYIMGILCVYPQPVYTQLLPKTFMKSDALSYFHPQFGSIGMQPISYREVCPVQVYQESGDLDATFGYQRPWYDLIAATDEAHGNMRTNMRDFLMHRTFAGIPKLGYDFLHIDPEQLNDVFSITDGSDDVFQGQVNLQVYIKRAIPRFGIPKLD